MTPLFTELAGMLALLREGWILCDESAELGPRAWSAQPPSLQVWAPTDHRNPFEDVDFSSQNLGQALR